VNGGTKRTNGSNQSQGEGKKKKGGSAKKNKSLESGGKKALVRRPSGKRVISGIVYFGWARRDWPGGEGGGVVQLYQIGVP